MLVTFIYLISVYWIMELDGMYSVFGQKATAKILVALLENEKEMKYIDLITKTRLTNTTFYNGVDILIESQLITQRYEYSPIRRRYFSLTPLGIEIARFVRSAHNTMIEYQYRQHQLGLKKEP